MLIGIIGENCAGKSTLAEKIKDTIGAEIITGKDYLRMAKSESEARILFRDKLENAVDGENVIYVISEPDLLSLLPEGAVRIHVSAGLEIIMERFRARMHGNLPEPVARMLEKKHRMFDGGDYDYCFDSAKDNADELCAKLKKL